MRYILCLCILLILSASTLKLKKKYEYKGADNFYLEFITKENFKLEMYSCLYSLRIMGNYSVTKDTIFLDYKSFETRSEDHKSWIKIDSTNADYDHISNEQMIFLNRFNKLVRTNNDKILMPHGIRRAFYSKHQDPF